MSDKEDGTTTGDNPPIEVQRGPLVSVTFQRNPARHQKYLEAQPKELGITQIGLSFYQVTWVYALYNHEAERANSFLKVPFIIASTVVMVAGSLAIAAKTLHIPTLRACLTMQILAIVSSVFTMVLMLMFFEGRSMHSCWFNYGHENETSNHQNHCERFEHAHNHLQAGGMLVQMALVAISVTLTVYCCKVISCCTPGYRMPVITVQAPPDPSALQ